MKLRVSLRPTEALGQEKGEVATACVDCGNGEQILRWLAFAACDRVAHLANLPAGTFVPQAVINREGIVEDVDAMIRARYADGDGVVVRFSRGPEAFTARWEGRPTTPPASETPASRVVTEDERAANDELSMELLKSAATDTPEEPHHAAGVAWLERRLDFDAFGMRELVGDSATSSQSDKLRCSEELAVARAALLAHAGGLQALFKLYESDGDVEMRDVDKMNLEQFRRFMVDAKAIEFGPQTITAADVDSCFNEALKRKGGEKEQKGVAKTLDAVAFLVAVFRVAAKKYDLAVIKDPNWSITHIKVELIEGKDKGKTKSYKPSDLVLVTSLGAAAALKPIEISLIGELEEVGSQRQLLTDDDFFQVDCGGSSGGERPEGWFW